MKIYLVGGAVRDIFMKLEPKDRDYVIVGATDEDVQRMLTEGYEQVGKDFPVFLHPDTKAEYALARVERKTGVGYGGFEVNTCNVSLEEDLARRDLTMNAMAMDLDTGVIIDPFNGRDDIVKGIIRHTTTAFAEDPLRALRVARFAARYGYEIAQETIELVKQIGESGELNHLTPERIWLELQKAESDGNFSTFMFNLQKTDVLKNCKFLRNLIGEEVSQKTHQIMLRAQLVPEHARFDLLIAAIARTQPQAGATRRMLDGFALLREYGATEWTARGVYDLIRVAGAFREGTKFDDLISLICLTQTLEVSVTHTKILLEAEGVCKQITAADFPERQGKALGDAIEAARIEAIASMLKHS